MKKNQKITKEEIESIDNIIRGTNIPISMFTKGRCYIEHNIKKEECKLSGEPEDLKVLNECLITVEGKPKVVEFMKHFGWSFKEEGDNVTGEGVTAYMLFMIMMGNINDTKTINEFFSKVKFII